MPKISAKWRHRLWQSALRPPRTLGDLLTFDGNTKATRIRALLIFGEPSADRRDGCPSGSMPDTQSPCMSPGLPYPSRLLRQTSGITARAPRAFRRSLLTRLEAGNMRSVRSGLFATLTQNMLSLVNPRRSASAERGRSHAALPRSRLL